jgi:muramoyltetrapeptide carboxypeptidase LdcA involved in peptidoglycan recycling
MRGRVFIEGEATGVILATNLESLVINFGTKYDPLLNIDDQIILIVEEWKEDISRLQRHFEAIFDHINFDRVGALILGRLAQLREGSYPKWAKNTDIYELLLHKLVQRGRIPFAQIDYFGHASSWPSRSRTTENNLAWVNGAKMAVSIRGGVNPRHGKVIFSCLDE